MAQRFRKKRLDVEAMLYDGSEEAFDAILAWGEEHDIGMLVIGNYSAGIVITTLEGEMRASPGDWIIKGVADEFYPCKPDIFEQTYEAV